MSAPRAWIAALFALILICASPLVSAQENTDNAPDYSQWDSVAKRAEAAIDAGRASDTAMEALRAALVSYRQLFQAARDINSARIKTLQAQLQALGPMPESGDEAPDIAKRRSELNEQLTTLRAPVLVAEAAYNRANGLVGEVDRIIRDRQANAFLTVGATPLNPVLWGPALGTLGDALHTLRSETQSAWRSPVLRIELRQNLPLILLLLVLAMVLLARGRGWAERIGNYLRLFGGAGSGVWGFLVSLGRIALPLAGVYALVEAIFASGLVGLRGTFVLDAVPVWAAVLLGLRWLCERLFSRRDEDALISFVHERRSELRFYGTLLALFYVLRHGVEVLMQVQNASDDRLAVVTFPIDVMTCVVLFRLGQILYRNSAAPADDDPAISPGLARVLRVLGRGVMGVAFIAPVLAGIGYGALSNAILYPSVVTLALFGVVIIAQRFAADVYGLISGQGTAARETLVPVLIGFVLILSALPVLALVWGARVADLTELWARFREGFAIGDARISPTDFLAFAVIFALGYALTRLLQGALRTNLLPKTRMDVGGQIAIVSGTGYIGIFLAALVAISGAGIDLSSLAIVAGALSVGIGFGLQNIVSNFVSGIILLIERPISEGDWIEVGGQMGYVRDISVRSTRIETFDRTDVIVPNADLISGTVTNYTRGNTVGRVIVPVGVAYGTDTRRVEKILGEIANAHPMVLAAPPPSVVFQGFGADSLDFEIRAILRDVNWVLSVKSDMNHQIAKRFEEEGIEIPFAQRDVWLRNPEALRGPEGESA
jgi:small-conductance mechanosensitive channel